MCKKFNQLECINCKANWFENCGFCVMDSFIENEKEVDLLHLYCYKCNHDFFETALSEKE